MPAKRATAKQDKEHGLTKAEACKLLQVAPSADEELITQAYWHQARKARAYAHLDSKARQRLDELNRAYRVLNPTSSEAPLESESPSVGRDGAGPDAFTSWLNRLVQQTARRWAGRAAEIAVLSATTLILTVLALQAGADLLYVLITAGIAGLTIWAPWRRA